MGGGRLSARGSGGALWAPPLGSGAKPREPTIFPHLNIIQRLLLALIFAVGSNTVCNSLQHHMQWKHSFNLTLNLLPCKIKIMYEYGGRRGPSPAWGPVQLYPLSPPVAGPGSSVLVSWKDTPRLPKVEFVLKGGSCSWKAKLNYLLH